MVSTFQVLAGTALTFGKSIEVTVIGIITVFAVLAILIVLIEALHAVLKDKKSDAPKKAEVSSAPKKEEKRISAGVMAEAPEATKADEDSEFIAAVSAAITCVTGSSDFKIKSIKKG